MLTSRKTTTTGELAKRAEGELNAVIAQYSAGEAEVVRAYFERPHTSEEHLDVLLRQMGREIQAANRLRPAAEMFQRLEVTVDRHEFADYLEHIAEEAEHYAILADLAEWVAGRKLTADEAFRYEVYARWVPGQGETKETNALLPEANRQMEVSRALVAELGFELGNPLSRLSEGGGGGAYIECMRLTGDEFRERLAAAMRRILQDEIHHGPARVHGFPEQWIKADEDIARTTRWLRTYMAQHLRVRNEIWGYPVSAERLAAIDRGELAPFDPTMDL